jgi:Zn-dependent peptidase ImmA (M78 family)/DNA-binding XRE family transcriptional regulator
MIGNRIKKARNALGLNQRKLAEQANISAMAISKYERGESMPSSSVLMSLADALGVRVEYFFRQTEINLTDVEYREHEKLPEKEEVKVFADVEEQIERWIELEEFLPTAWSTKFELPEGLPDKLDSLGEIEVVANHVREIWQLGLNPVPDLIDTLETKGIKVFITQYDGNKHFNGLSAKVNDSPVIVIGKNWPGDRQRFTLGHELGHIILHERLSVGLDEEKACHRFAGSFLAPDIKVKQALGEKRSWLEPQELMSLKHEWGLSMGGLIYRAFDLGIVSKVVMGKLWGMFRKNGWKDKEPEPQYPNEKTRIFKQGVYHALAEDMIGESKAAELLGMSVMDLHACRKMECPDAIINK